MKRGTPSSCFSKLGVLHIVEMLGDIGFGFRTQKTGEWNRFSRNLDRAIRVNCNLLAGLLRTVLRESTFRLLRDYEGTESKDEHRTFEVTWVLFSIAE